MEARLVALDDIAHAIICEVAFLRLTKDASGNQTSQGYFLGVKWSWELLFLVANIPIFSSSIPVFSTSSARLTPFSESPMTVAKSRSAARRRLADTREDAHSTLMAS